MRAGMSSSIGSDGETKGQKHYFIFNYLPASLWDKQSSRALSELDRSIEMVKFCHSIGLYFPDALTIKTIVTTMILAQSSSPTVTAAKALYDTFNTQNKARRPLKKVA